MISIIIVNYNTKELLKNCLKSIFKTTLGFSSEMIVIDNNSSDHSQEMIKKSFPKVKLIEMKKNVGFAQANNQGAKIAQGDILFFLNPDTLIHKNIFQKIVEIFETNSKVGIVAPQLVLSDGLPQPWVYGKKDGLWQLIKNKFYPVVTQTPKYSNNQTINVDWVSGAAFFIKKNIFEETEGFDENFFMYFEDKDLCYRVKELGYKIVINNEVKVVHFVGKSPILNRDRKKIYYQAQNYYWRKHYSLGSFILMLFIRWPYKFYILHMKINQNLICF